MPIKHLKVVRKSVGVLGGKQPPWKSLLTSIALAGAALALIGFFVLTLALAWLSRDLPDPNALLTRNIAQSTKIFDRSGETLLYEIHGDEKRTLVKIEDIPDIMKQATIAVEDRDFYNHHGIYWRGLVRAFVVNTLQGRRVSGTSTLTQQFVKNALLTNERSVTRKLKEILLSLQIERKFSKEQILQLYLNEIPYGSTLYGVQAASQSYFGKSVKDLTLDEAAFLAALPQAPDTYNPYGAGSRGDNRDGLVARQHTILDLMADQGYISKDQASEAKNIDTLAKLIPKRIGDIRAPHFVTWVREQLVEKYGQVTVETGGLNVVTTLDWRLQQAAEEAVKAGVEARGERYGFTNAALVSIGPKDGHVLAMVGSKDFFDEENDGQVNATLRPLQPGSSFKPIVYAAGFLKGYLPETTLWDVNTTFKTETKDYAPKDYDLKERGPVSIRQALQGSLNIPAVQMLYLVGVGPMLDLAEQLGYTTLADRSRFGLSLVLGGGEVKPIEHTAAYGAFANDGVLVPTVGILKVQDAAGTTLEEWKPTEGRRVFEPQIARLVSNVLSDNDARIYVFGQGNALTLPGRPVAAKTGTTNDYNDAWTMGYTPSLVSGVWVGNMDGKEMKRGADGSIVAAPIWQAYMKEATKGTPVESFTAPAPPDTDKAVLLGKAYQRPIKIDKVTGKLATDLTPPEFVEERLYAEAHNILYYVDKDDPRGPIPTDPASDPQYNNWENAVQDWVARTQWAVTSTPPTESDDLHTIENAPRVTIQSPSPNGDLSSRSFTITTSVTAPLRIMSVSARMDGYLLGGSWSGVGDIQAVIPNALSKGSHELIVEARDSVGNLGRATVMVNVLADPSPLQISVTDPSPGTSVKRAEFPRSVSVAINDLSDIAKVNLYAQLPNGATQLLGSDLTPGANPIIFRWTAAEVPGDYALFAEVSDKNGVITVGDKTAVRVE